MNIERTTAIADPANAICPRCKGVGLIVSTAKIFHSHDRRYICATANEKHVEDITFRCYAFDAVRDISYWWHNIDLFVVCYNKSKRTELYKFEQRQYGSGKKFSSFIVLCSAVDPSDAGRLDKLLLLQ